MFGNFLCGNFLGHVSILETLWLETFWLETFWLETFCPMLSVLETLWPETFWAETFWADTVQRTQRMSISTQLFLCNKTILQIQNNIYKQKELIYLSEFIRYGSNIIMSVPHSLTKHKVLFCILFFLTEMPIFIVCHLILSQLFLTYEFTYL